MAMQKPDNLMDWVRATLQLGYTTARSEKGKTTTDAQMRVFVQGEMNNVIEVLWSDAVSDCAGNFEPGRAEGLFTRRVFNWVSRQRGSSATTIKELLTNWGQQSILFTFSVKGHDIGQVLDPHAPGSAANSAWKEAHDVAALDLWEKAIADVGSEDAPGIGLVYNRIVLDWCARHLGYAPPTS